jgi:hypothetical protein
MKSKPQKLSATYIVDYLFRLLQIVTEIYLILKEEEITFNRNLFDRIVLDFLNKYYIFNRNLSLILPI